MQKLHNKTDAVKGDELTQLGRAVKTLDIELITANSPQAKGKVERANELLQDRLVKELRLMNISTIEKANEFLDRYKDKLNGKFAVYPKSQDNAYRKLLHTDDELDLIFSIHSKRTISNNLELQYKNTIYQIKVNGLGLTMRKAKATICEDFKGSVVILYKGRKMNYTTYKRAERQSEVESAKTINNRVSRAIQIQDERSGYKQEIDKEYRKDYVEQSQNRTF